MMTMMSEPELMELKNCRNDDKQTKAQPMMAPLLSDSETTSAMAAIRELRQQRLAIFLSRGAIGQEVSFYFVTFFLDKQKESKDEPCTNAERKKEVNEELKMTK